MVGKKYLKKVLEIKKGCIFALINNKTILKMSTNNQKSIYKVFFKSPSEIDLIEQFEYMREAIEKANKPGMYWSKKIENDPDSCIEIVDANNGCIVFFTLTENEIIICEEEQD